MTYTLQGREVVAGGKLSGYPASPCIFCGRLLHDEGQHGQMVGAEIDGVVRLYRYHSLCPEAEADRKAHPPWGSVWRCGCLKPFVENVGVVCHGCGHPREQATTYARVDACTYCKSVLRVDESTAVPRAICAELGCQRVWYWWPGCDGTWQPAWALPEDGLRQEWADTGERETALLRQLYVDEDDVAARLVYADWLEDERRHEASEDQRGLAITAGTIALLRNKLCYANDKRRAHRLTFDQVARAAGLAVHSGSFGFTHGGGAVSARGRTRTTCCLAVLIHPGRLYVDVAAPLVTRTVTPQDAWPELGQVDGTAESWARLRDWCDGRRGV